MEDLWKQTILFFLETSGPVFQFFLETSSPVFQFLPGCLARNKTAVLSLTWILMPHSLQRIDGRIGWWDHTKQHSCGSLHTLCLYFKERNECPLVRWLQITGCTSNSQDSLGFNEISRRDKETAACIQGNKALLIGIWLYILPSVSLLRVWLFFRQMHAT